MDKKKIIAIKIIVVVILALVSIIALPVVEMGINYIYSDLRVNKVAAPVLEEGAAKVVLSRIPQVKTEKDNSAAVVLWVATYVGAAKDLTEQKIFDEVGACYSEVRMYDGLDKYMTGRWREQLRNLPDGAMLEQVYVSIKNNRPIIATMESAAGSVQYGIIVGFDPVLRTVSVYSLESGEVNELPQDDFLKKLKFENANKETKASLFFGAVTKNSILIVS